MWLTSSAQRLARPLGTRSLPHSRGRKTRVKVQLTDGFQVGAVNADRAGESLVQLLNRESRQSYEPLSVCRSSKRSYKDLDWQRMIDHIATEIWIVIVWLGTLVCSDRTR